VPPWRVTRRRRELDVHRPRTRHPDTPIPDVPAAGTDEHLTAIDPTGDPALAALHADPEIAAWAAPPPNPPHPATVGGGSAGPVELTRRAAPSGPPPGLTPSNATEVARPAGVSV